MSDNLTDLIEARMRHTEDAMRYALSKTLYGDDQPYVPPTLWQRFRTWLADNRITNAWLVLIGREDIDRGYY